MQILGKIELQGKEKELLLKEENEFLKYYTLELIGAYSPQIREQKIVLKKDIEMSKETQIKIIKLVNEKMTPKMLQASDILKIIGEIDIEGEKKELLAKKDGEIIKYYYLNLIGVYTQKIPGQTIIFRQETLENRLLTEAKDKEPRRAIAPLEQEKIEQFLKQIKILDIIEKIQTQDRGVKERTQYNRTVKTNEIAQNQKQQEKNVEKNAKESLQQQQKQTEKKANKTRDINIKQEVNMNTRVTDMKNLEQVLQKNKKIPELEHGDAPLKMGIVESDDLKKLKNEKGEKEQGHASRYESVVITKQGKVQTLDLENDTQEGTNPLEKNHQVKQNDSVKKGDTITRLKVGEGTVGIEKGQYGEVEVYHSPRKTLGGKGVEGNKSLDRQLETSNAKNSIKGTNIETLKLAQEHGDGYRSTEQSYQEVEQHKEKYKDCEPKGVEDLDGDKNTHAHTHMEGTDEYVELSSGEKVTYNELASRWGFYKDGKPDANFAKEKFTQKEQEDKGAEEVIAELDEEYEDPRVSNRGR